MSYQLASKAVFKLIERNSDYPIRSLNRFKTDPRVLVGPTWKSFPEDTWAAFEFGAKLQSARKHYFVFQARSRFYAIEATSAREAMRVVEQYRPIREAVRTRAHEGVALSVGVAEIVGGETQGGPASRQSEDRRVAVDIPNRGFALEAARRRFLGVLRTASSGRPVRRFRPGGSEVVKTIVNARAR